jgi:glycosyltransferase involved in cell wall biosynthesis
VLLPPVPVAALRTLHLGGYWRGANDIVRQMMLGLRDTGSEVVELCTDLHPELIDPETAPYDRGTSGPVWVRDEALAPWLREHDPQLVVCNAGGLSLRPAAARRLRENRCLVGVALSDPDVHRATTSRIAANFDRFFTNDPSLLDAYRALGAEPAALPIGTHPGFFRPLAPRPEMVCDVLVLGRAHADRIAPVRALAARFDLHLYGEGWEEHGLASRGLLFGDDVLAALASARTTVVFFRTPAGAAIVKVGLFDFLAAGALVLTNRSELTARLLEFDREIVGFDGTAELIAAVAELLRDPARRQRIREAGRARVLRDHTWSAIWRRLLGDLGALPTPMGGG